MNKFAVFDIDGTLIRWQLFHAVANKLAQLGHLPEDSWSEIQEARMRWKRRETDDAFHDYENKLIELFEKSLKQIAPEIVEEVVKEVAEEYKSQVYVYTRELASSLKNKGYKLIAISGSSEDIVGYVARNYGFDLWVGSNYGKDDCG